MPLNEAVASKLYVPPAVEGSTASHRVWSPNVPTVGGGVGVNRIDAPGIPRIQPVLSELPPCSPRTSIVVSSSCGTAGFGVSSEGIAVASDESMRIARWDPVTAKSVTTSSRTVKLPSVENMKLSKIAA